MSTTALNQMSKNVYWLSPDERTDRPILGAISGNRGTLLVDAGNSPAHAELFLDELVQANIIPPKFLVLTHCHWDHVFGTAAIDLPTFAHQDTKRIVAEMAELDWSDQALDQRVEAGLEIEFCRDMIKAELPDRRNLRLRPPDIAFTNRIELDLGGITCRIEHIGGDHATDSSVVYIQQDKIVFISDCLAPDLYHQPPSYTTARLFPLLDQLLSYNADVYLAGHEPEPISRAELTEWASRAKTIGQAVERTGDNRGTILAQLAEILDPQEDDIEIVDAFLAGLGT